MRRLQSPVRMTSTCGDDARLREKSREKIETFDSCTSVRCSRAYRREKPRFKKNSVLALTLEAPSVDTSVAPVLNSHSHSHVVVVEKEH